MCVWCAQHDPTQATQGLLDGLKEVTTQSDSQDAYNWQQNQDKKLFSDKKGGDSWVGGKPENWKKKEKKRGGQKC